ncbi:MAG: helix-turn-helix domain-containing protein [Alphaproteobacteria bacterium]
MEIQTRTISQIGQALKRFRKSKKMTQVQVGKLSGLRQATISDLESGDTTSQLRTLEYVLAALNLELIVRAREESSIDDWAKVFADDE